MLSPSLKVILISLVIIKMMTFGFVVIEEYNQKYYACPPYCGIDHDHRREEEDEEDED